MKRFIVLFLLCSGGLSGQEYLHWKYNEFIKKDKVRFIYQKQIDPKTGDTSFFGYEELDRRGNVLAIRMYLQDTLFYEYDSLNNPVKTYTGKAEKNLSYHQYTYDKGGRILHEKKLGNGNCEKWYEHDKPGNITSMTIAPNIIVKNSYDAKGKLMRHDRYENNILNYQTSCRYDKEKNLMVSNSWNSYLVRDGFGENSFVYSYYDEEGREIKTVRQYWLYDEKKTEIEEYEYDSSGNIVKVMATNNLIKYYYENGYLKMAERYGRSGQLEFMVIYDYVFFEN